MTDEFGGDLFNQSIADEGASSGNVEERRDRTVRLSESDVLDQALAEAWQRWRNAQDKSRDAEAAQEEVGAAAMDLEEALVAAAIAWLSEQWGTHKPCPYCGNAEWTVGLPIKWAGPAPVFTVTCNQCANTVLINAVAAGVLEEDDVEDL